jgi:hypothetical protein
LDGLPTGYPQRHDYRLKTPALAFVATYRIAEVVLAIRLGKLLKYVAHAFT